MEKVPRYQFWDKKSTIYTPSGKVRTAEEWLAQYGWAQQENAKAVISGGDINGGCMLNFKQLVDTVIRRGAVITDDMTDDEILAAIEAFEDAEEAAAMEAAAQPTSEERIAAALELQTLASLPDETEA